MCSIVTLSDKTDFRLTENCTDTTGLCCEWLLDNTSIVALLSVHSRVWSSTNQVASLWKCIVQKSFKLIKLEINNNTCNFEIDRKISHSLRSTTMRLEQCFWT